MIPFLDWGENNRRHRDNLCAAFARVTDSGKYVLGGEVSAFEQSFATYCGRRHCIGVASGLDALTLILRAGVACGRIPAGSEVVVPANTYIASVLAVLHAGLVPRLVSPEAESFNLPADESFITADTGAVMAVHLYGRAADMKSLSALCQKRGVFLLSDAAQAHGAMCGAQPAAAFGDAAGFSFYPGKNLGALGDGGAVVIDDDDLAAHVRLLRNYGAAEKYHNTAVGVNSRLDEVQAAILSAKLPSLDADNARRREIAARYCQTMTNSQITLPTPPKDENEHVWHLFVVRCKRRDALIRHLHDSGVGTLIHYPVPPHKQPAFAGMPFAAVNIPLAEEMADEVLSLPLNPALSDEDAGQVIAAINGFSD